MEDFPPWMRTIELVTGLLAVLCVLAVLMIIVMHLWWRTGCSATGIC